MAADRETLARQQRDMLKQILHTADRDLDHARKTLAGKRQREAAVAAPILARALADSFATHFETYAREHPYPAHGGPTADAAAFIRWLNSRGELPAPALREAALLSARAGRRVFRLRGNTFFAIRFGHRLWIW